jgi:phosphoglycolate phosphatase
MGEMTKRLAIFDCDGTLVDGQANHCFAMDAAFIGAGLKPLSGSITRRVIGLSLSESMRKLVPDTDELTHQKMVEHYKSAFWAMREKGEIEEPLYDGIGSLLSAMVDDGWLLGVATGKSDRGLERCLDFHGIKGMFVTLQTADRHPSKPHPSMIHQALAESNAAASDAVMIGDTVYDIHMGVAAGCKTIGVGWGYHPLDELRAAGADHVVETMDELKLTLEKLL